MEWLNELWQSILENWGAIGTMLAVIFCRTKGNKESLEAKQMAKLERQRSKSEKAKKKLQESLQKEANLEKEINNNA